eukprot:366507-Chlamydomonas_euryale.AAC.5
MADALRRMESYECAWRSMEAHGGCATLHGAYKGAWLVSYGARGLRSSMRKLGGPWGGGHDHAREIMAAMLR